MTNNQSNDTVAKILAWELPVTQYIVSSAVSGVNANPGDTVLVVSGGTDTDYTVYMGGLIVAEAGATLVSGVFSDLTNFYDGSPTSPIEEIVSNGGRAIGTIVQDGEQFIDGGTAVSTIVNGDASSNAYIPGEQVVANGGVAVRTTVNTSAYSDFRNGEISADASQTIQSGGTSILTNLSGYADEYYGPFYNEAVLNVIATETVDSGGTATDTTIGFDSSEYIAAGGSIDGTTTITGITETLFAVGSITHSVLELNGPAGSGTIDLVHSSGELIIDGLTMPTNEIINIGQNSLIDLSSVRESSVTGVQALANELIVDTTSGNFTLQVENADSRSYIVAPDAHGGTELLCYVQGTHILTPTGERLIEDLRIGDLVVTRYSGLQPIRWIGRQSYVKRFLRDTNHKTPVRIQAGALGKNLPARDLSVSSGHSMLLATENGEEQLVLVSSLINGITITQDKTPEEIHYFQLDLLSHDCVIAEGTWSETYGDGDRLRNQFHNVAEFYQLYPDHREPDELILCARRPERGPKLDQALRQVVIRAMAGITPGPITGCIDLIPTPWKVEGWAHDSDYPDLPVLLEVLLGDKPLGTVLACDYRSDLEQAGIGRGYGAFAFSSPVRIHADTMHEIRVRRLIDGAELFMSAACHEHIDRDRNTLIHVNSNDLKNPILNKKSSKRAG